MTTHSATAAVTTTAKTVLSVVGRVDEFTDYSRYRFRAEVDWIELKIVLTKPTNFQTVRRRLDVQFAESDDPGAGGAGVEFTVKIQSPSSWAEVNARLERLTVDHPLAKPVAVTGIEIALDAYSRNESFDDLVEMASRFYREACKLVSSNRRASKTKRDGSYALESADQLRRLVTDGYNIYIGNRTDAERQHIYVKQTDGQSFLPLAQQRARTEFTLTGEKVPELLFNDWREYRFESFAAYFKYRQLKTELPLYLAKPMLTSAQVGERRPRMAHHGKNRSFSRCTQADLKLNALAHDALRELARRWKAEMKDK